MKGIGAASFICSGFSLVFLAMGVYIWTRQSPSNILSTFFSNDEVSLPQIDVKRIQVDGSILF